MSVISGIRSLKDTVQQTVTGALEGIEKAHLTVLHQPFALLSKINVLAEPLKSLEEGQQKVTTTIYLAIRTLTQVPNAVVTKVLDLFEKPADAPQAR